MCRMDGRASGSINRPPAIRARSYCLSEAERRLQAGEGDTDLLRSGIPQEV